MPCPISARNPLMRFFIPKTQRGHEAVWEARAGSCLHVALIVRLEGLETATDAVPDALMDRGGAFWTQLFIFSCKYTTKGGKISVKNSS